MIPEHLTEQQKQYWLLANCDPSPPRPYFRPFEQSEIDLARTNHSDLSIEIADSEEEIKEMRKLQNERLKSLKETRTEILKSIRRKGVEETGKTFTYKNYENQTITVYTSAGVQIDFRRMTPDERQLSITDSNIRRIGNG